MSNQHLHLIPTYYTARIYFFLCLCARITFFFTEIGSCLLFDINMPVLVFLNFYCKISVLFLIDHEVKFYFIKIQFSRFSQFCPVFMERESIKILALS